MTPKSFEEKKAVCLKSIDSVLGVRERGSKIEFNPDTRLSHGSRAMLVDARENITRLSEEMRDASAQRREVLRLRIENEFGEALTALKNAISNVRADYFSSQNPQAKAYIKKVATAGRSIDRHCFKGENFRPWLKRYRLQVEEQKRISKELSKFR